MGTSSILQGILLLFSALISLLATIATVRFHDKVFLFQARQLELLPVPIDLQHSISLVKKYERRDGSFNFLVVKACVSVVQFSVPP